MEVMQVYRKSRVTWLINSFRDYQCPCGEAELCVLEWYPHHKKIRNLVYRNSVTSEARQQAIKLMEECTPMCSNCTKKIPYGLHPFVL